MCWNSKRFEKNLYFINMKQASSNSFDTIRYYYFDENAKKELNKSFAKKAYDWRNESMSTLATSFYS